MEPERPNDPEETKLLADIDQITAGLARRDPATVLKARQTLALIARDGDPNLLLWVYEALAAKTEARDDGS